MIPNHVYEKNKYVKMFTFRGPLQWNSEGRPYRVVLGKLHLPHHQQDHGDREVFIIYKGKKQNK